jgi:hypothetical protein
MERAAAGVDVRFVYDWLGSTARAFPSFFAGCGTPACPCGCSARCGSPRRCGSAGPSQTLGRRRRRRLRVRPVRLRRLDGNPARGVEPWRDTGVEIRGPAVADLEASFAEIWALAGPRLPESAPSRSDPTTERRPAPCLFALSPAVRASSAPTGSTSSIAASARRSLWLTDAYFLGSRAYVQALGEAARDGVDVRLLLPAASDVPLLQPIVQAGYRRWSRRGCGCSSGTAPCSTPRPRSRTGPGPASARPTSTWRAGPATGSSTSRSRTRVRGRDGGHVPRRPVPLDEIVPGGPAGPGPAPTAVPSAARPGATFAGSRPAPPPSARPPAPRWRAPAR